MLGYRLGHASEQEFLKPFSPVRAKHDTMGPPDCGHVENAHFRLAFDHARKHLLKSRGTKRVNRMAHDLFSSSMPFLHAGILFKERGALNNVNKKNFGALRAYLCRQDLSGRIGELRTVDRQQYPHNNPPCVCRRALVITSRAGDCIAQTAEGQRRCHRLGWRDLVWGAAGPVYKRSTHGFERCSPLAQGRSSMPAGQPRGSGPSAASEAVLGFGNQRMKRRR